MFCLKSKNREINLANVKKVFGNKKRLSRNTITQNQLFLKNIIEVLTKGGWQIAFHELEF